MRRRDKQELQHTQLAEELQSRRRLNQVHLWNKQEQMLTEYQFKTLESYCF